MEAYRAVFGGVGQPEDAALVLDDLERFTGFWEVTTADTPDQEARFAEGQRSVFARLRALMRVTDATLDQIDARGRELEEETE